MDCSRSHRGFLAGRPMLRPRSLALLTVGLLLIVTAPVAARKPVVAYIDPSTGVFLLYDTETATSPSAPSLPTGITRYSMSSDGRYVAYSHPTTKAIHLFDRQTSGELPLPGIDIVANPGSPSVSDAGLIAFDDNGNGPARVYDSLAGTFLATGLPANNGHRQTRLSADGNRLASTCLGGFAGSPCAVDLGGDGAVFVQNLVLGLDTAFPDDVAVAGEPSENRPCIDADGSLVGFDAFAGGATGNNVYLYDRGLGALVPVPALQTAAAERERALDVDGSYVGVMDNDGNASVYHRAGAAFLALPSSLQGLSAPIWLTQPLQIRPDTRIVSAPAGAVSTTSATFTFDSPNAPAATFRCTLDGVIEDPCTSPRAYASLNQGPRTFTVTAKDAGLEDLSPASRSWTVDTVPPDTTIVEGPEGSTTAPAPTFRFSSNEPDATFECRYDRAPFEACPNPAAPIAARGERTFEVRAVDAAGNTDPTPARRTFEACDGSCRSSPPGRPPASRLPATSATALEATNLGSRGRRNTGYLVSEP